MTCWLPMTCFLFYTNGLTFWIEAVDYRAWLIITWAKTEIRLVRRLTWWLILIGWTLRGCFEAFRGHWRPRFFTQLLSYLCTTTLIIRFSFLEMAYPHHRVEFKRAAVRTQKGFTPPPGTTGISEAGRLTLELFTDFLEQSFIRSDHRTLGYRFSSLPGRCRWLQRRTIYIFFKIGLLIKISKLFFISYLSK